MIAWNGAAGDPSAARAVLFDFDGTLADTKPVIVKTAIEVLVGFGLDEATVVAKVDDLVGPPFPDAFSQVFGLSATDADEVTRRYRQQYSTYGREAWPFFPGVAELLARLRAAGRLLAVASSKRQPMIDRGIADNGAGDLFDAVVGKREGVVDTKAEAIETALGRLDVTPAEAVMVGDRHHDVEGARAAGMGCVGVLFGNTAGRRELADAGALATVDTVDELESVLLGR